MAHPLRWLTLVALKQAELPSFESVAAWYAAAYPHAPPLKPAGSTASLLTFTVGDLTGAVTLVPRPIPWSQLEGPAEAAWYWPEAITALRDHAAHLLITLVDDAGKPVEKALALTRVTAGAAATSPSVGVFWGPGRLIHPPGAFLEQAADAGDHNLPLFLWVDFRVDPIEGVGGTADASRAYRLFTTGLEALGSQEIEVPRYVGEPQALVGFVYNIAHYLLEKRKAVNDGDTIGVTDVVQATIRRGPSMLGGALEVLQVSFD